MTNASRLQAKSWQHLCMLRVPGVLFLWLCRWGTWEHIWLPECSGFLPVETQECRGESRTFLQSGGGARYYLGAGKCCRPLMCDELQQRSITAAKTCGCSLRGACGKQSSLLGCWWLYAALPSWTNCLLQISRSLLINPKLKWKTALIFKYHEKYPPTHPL